MPNSITVHEAADLLPRCARILVIGRSGGGKSTLSVQLSQTYELGYISRDRDVFWLPGWTIRDPEERRALVAKFVAG